MQLHSSEPRGVGQLGRALGCTGYRAPKELPLRSKPRQSSQSSNSWRLSIHACDAVRSFRAEERSCSSIYKCYKQNMTTAQPAPRRSDDG
jgi:hypothetical protein